MKFSKDNVEGLLLVGAAIAGVYVAWRAYGLAGSAAQSVSDTINGITDKVKDLASSVGGAVSGVVDTVRNNASIGGEGEIVAPPGDAEMSAPEPEAGKPYVPPDNSGASFNDISSGAVLGTYSGPQGSIPSMQLPPTNPSFSEMGDDWMTGNQPQQTFSPSALSVQ